MTKYARIVDNRRGKTFTRIAIVEYDSEDCPDTLTSPEIVRVVKLWDALTDKRTFQRAYQEAGKLHADLKAG